MSNLSQVRIDKYLWAIRFFKTRTLATTACNAGKVKINGQSIKPAYKVKVGDVFSVRKNHQVLTIEVLQVIEKRVGAKIAVECYKDITPEEDKVNIHRSAFYTNERRDRGTGRPTKKERRDIQEFKEDDFENWEEW